MQRTRRSGGSRLGTFLFLVGCLVVLLTAFAAGVLTGRYWTRPGSGAGTARAAAPREASGTAPAAAGDRRGGEASAGRGAAASILNPPLTFYQELTAPLTPSEPPARPRTPARVAAAPAQTERSTAERPAPPPAPRPATTPASSSGAPGTEQQYTIQVGAYRVKSPAEALRASLAAAGHDAYIVETEAAGGARYRVRVGSFATRQAAVDAAARLGGERPVSTYVTTR